MSGPIVGNVEMAQASSLSTGSAQSTFVNLYRFLNDNTGSLGIQRIAFNTGSQGTGMTLLRGMNYYDQANPAGENAWACFKFVSASNPFNVLIQWTGSTNIGTAPGSPALFNNSTTQQVLCIAIAQSADSTQLWNGSTNNNGSDTKGTPVWVSSSVSSTIYYPRSNDPIRAGGHGASRQNMMGVGIGNGLSVRSHFIADYDSLILMIDPSQDNSYNIFAFGKYTPMSGVSSQVPYFCFVETNPVSAAGTLIGPVAGGTLGGGTSYPSPQISGSVTMAFDRMSYFNVQTAAQPNRAFAIPRWDEFSLHIGMFENPILGLLGQHNELLREVYNLATHDTNGDGSRAVFGALALANVKYTMPFHTGTVPGTGVTREGIRFSIP